MLIFLGMSEVVACEPNNEEFFCKAIVSNNKFILIFPVLEHKDTWVWWQNNTKDNELEYAWNAKFGHCATSNVFVEEDFSVWVGLYKFPGQKERVSTLQELLKESQSDVMFGNNDGSSKNYNRIDGLRIFTTEINGNVVAGSYDRETIDRIFSKKPSYAYMSVNTPDINQNYMCFAKVEYKRN